MKDSIREEHESFGMLSLSKITCSHGNSLFGSSIKHQNTIRLSVKTAVKDRHLHKNWYHDKDTIVEIEMSPVQFAEAISTSMNSGGVPVTIKRANGKQMEECPEEHTKEIYEQEFKDDIKKVLGNTTKMLKLVEEKLKAKGQLKVSDRQELASVLYTLEQDIRANMPFVQNSFNKQVDKTIIEAKGEIEGFFVNAIHKLGSEKLVEQLENDGFATPQIEIK